MFAANLRWRIRCLEGPSFWAPSSNTLVCRPPKDGRLWRCGFSRKDYALGYFFGYPLLYCKGSQSLVSCEDFKGASRYRCGVEFLRRESRCFCCLMEGHVAGDCISKMVCEADGCGNRSHHTFFHKYVLREHRICWRVCSLRKGDMCDLAG